MQPKADPVVRSMLLLGVVVLFALVGLMADGNWPKVGRVASAGVVYALVLLWLRRKDWGAGRWWWFALAGACAGLVSALVRPVFVALIVPAQVTGGVLFGSVHWLALRLSPRLLRSEARRTQ